MERRECVRVSVRGCVQGVGFRAAARVEADRLGVGGWVRNLRDGNVEALVEGPIDAVRSFVAWCHRGPSEAQVQSVETTPETLTPQGAVRFFIIE